MVDYSSVLIQIFDREYALDGLNKLKNNFELKNVIKVA